MEPMLTSEVLLSKRRSMEMEVKIVRRESGGEKRKKIGGNVGKIRVHSFGSFGQKSGNHKIWAG